VVFRRRGVSRLSHFPGSPVPWDIRRSPRSWCDAGPCGGYFAFRADQAIRKIYFRGRPDLRRRASKCESRADSDSPRSRDRLAVWAVCQDWAPVGAGCRRAEGRASRAWRVRLQIVEGCGEERTRALQDLPIDSRYGRGCRYCTRSGWAARESGAGIRAPGASDCRLWRGVVKSRSPAFHFAIPRPAGHLAAPQVTRILPSFPGLLGRCVDEARRKISIEDRPDLRRAGSRNGESRERSQGGEIPAERSEAIKHERGGRGLSPYRK
jgi:hypothetical protein